MSGTQPTSHALRKVASRARVGVIVTVLVILSALVAGSLVSGTAKDKLILRATFADASPLLEGNDVRLGGVKVGTIATMRIVEGGAEVTIELDKAALPVHEDARLTIRPVSLLGERYVELDRGSADAPVLADGAEIGLAQTGSSVDLDQVLNTLDDPTAEGLAALVGTLGEGLDGNGESVQRALIALAPALRDTRGMTQTLKEQNATLNELVDSLSKVAAGVADDNGRQLDRLVDASTTILGQTRANEAAFRSMLQQLPGTLRTAIGTLHQLEGTADAATPTLRALRPTTGDLEDLSDELLAFADAADPALAAANPVLAKADALVQNARPVARLLRQQSPAILSDARSLDPLTRDLVGDFTSVMEFIRGWALATNGKDGLSHYFRAGLVLTEYSVTGLLPGGVLRTGTAGAPADSGKQPRSDGGAATPKSEGLVPGLLDGVGSILGGLLSPRTDSSGGVTGLTPRQEANALDLLLGGS